MGVIQTFYNYLADPEGAPIFCLDHADQGYKTYLNNRIDVTHKLKNTLIPKLMPQSKKETIKKYTAIEMAQEHNFNQKLAKLITNSRNIKIPRQAVIVKQKRILRNISAPAGGRSKIPLKEIL